MAPALRFAEPPLDFLVAELYRICRPMIIDDFSLRHLHRRKQFHSDCHGRQRFRFPLPIPFHECPVGPRPDYRNQPVILEPFPQAWTLRFPGVIRSQTHHQWNVPELLVLRHRVSASRYGHVSGYPGEVGIAWQIYRALLRMPPSSF